MKKYIITSLVLVTLVTITSYAVKKENNDMKVCYSENIWIKDNGTQDGLNLRSKVTIQLADDNHGRMNMFGYIKSNELTYRLDRAIYFDYQSIDYKGNYVINFTSFSITSSDNIPEEIFSNFIQLEQDKIKYYVNIIKIDDNIYLLKDESYSSFTCNVK
ncbi:FidL-like protein [Providencia vermicola]|uniref:FidL-like protein n=1 Tax=Providencia vermicola TaxID=333965 RepID=UPI001CECF9B5|nr:FidL-like protein [Providencia vermicola]USR65432.1 FidL-like protein [Providencia stuartii]